MTANRSWRAAMLVLAATASWMAAWYFAGVRGKTEIALGFALMIGTAVALLGLVVAAVLIRDAFVSGTPRTLRRLTVASLVCAAIGGLGAFFYVS